MKPRPTNAQRDFAIVQRSNAYQRHVESCLSPLCRIERWGRGALRCEAARTLRAAWLAALY